MDHRTAKDDMAGAKSSYPAISLSVMFFTYLKTSKTSIRERIGKLGLSLNFLLREELTV